MENNNIIKIIIILLLIILFIAFVYYIFLEKQKKLEEKEKQKKLEEKQDLTKCEINRLYREWEYINKRCDPSDNTTLLATKKSREIIINKINDNNICSFEPLTNEVILDTSGGFLNSNKQIEFRNNLKTLKTIQIENNIKEPNNILCKCDGPDTSLNASYSLWSNWNKTCPISTDTTKSDNEFIISRTRTRTYNKTRTELNNGKCFQSSDQFTKEVENNILCPRDCSDGWTNWSDCSGNCGLDATLIQPIISGKQVRKWTRISIPINGGMECLDQNQNQKEPETRDCSKNCNVDCSGGFIEADWGACSGTAYACLPANLETQPIRYGKQVKNWMNGIPSSYNGITCESKKIEKDCSQNCNIDCSGGFIEADWGICSGTKYSCLPANLETEPIRYGKQVKKWINGIPSSNNGITCESKKIEKDCSQNCNIDCSGGTWGEYSPCSAVPCGPASIERDVAKLGTKSRLWVGGTHSGTGSACPVEAPLTCTKNCNRYCKNNGGVDFTSYCSISQFEKTQLFNLLTQQYGGDRNQAQQYLDQQITNNNITIR